MKEELKFVVVPDTKGRASCNFAEFRVKGCFVFDTSAEAIEMTHKINIWLKKNNLNLNELTPNQLIKRKMEIGV